MTEKNLKELLSELNDILEKTDSVDSETRALVRDLDQDINRLLDPESPENDFDNVIDALSRVGI